MDIDGGVDIWYQVEGRHGTLLEGFTGQYIDVLLKEIKNIEGLPNAASTLQPFVKRQESDEEISLRELENKLGRNETLNFGELVSKYDIWKKNPIIVRLPVAAVITQDFEELRKRKVKEIASMKEAKRKKWSVNSTILPGERQNAYFVDPAAQEKNKALLENIEVGKYVLMHGARASGKSTRTWRVMEQLQASGYFCIYITFTGINFTADESAFWQSFGYEIQDTLSDFFGPRGYLQIDITVPDIKTADDFRRICRRQNELWHRLAIKRKEEGWPTDVKFFVIFIDEFDQLVYSKNVSIRDNFLAILHSIKTGGDTYIIRSVVGVGTFSILTLNTNSRSLPPFNISDAFPNPNFTPEQVTTLFKEFATEYKLEIPDNVIQDICLNTNGHAGLVNLCGRAIWSLMEEHAHVLKGHLPYSVWKAYSGEPLGAKIAEYRTFDEMIRTLSKESSRDANNLLRTSFLGFRDNVEIQSAAKRDLANFLVGEGILLAAEGTGNEMAFKMSSPYVDNLIRRRILPYLDISAPKRAPIKRTNGTYDVLHLVTAAVRYFNKDILRNAVTRAFKTPKHGKVEGKTFQDVPRESVYDSELYRIFVRWLVDGYEMKITGQWHVVTETDPTNPTSKLDHEYFDIVILTNINRQPMIILVLMASGIESEVQKHFDKALKYGLRFDHPEVWVIHFTCLDGATAQPLWQSKEELEQGLNVVHFWHDRSFTQMRMCARWLEDSTEKIIPDCDFDLQNEHIDYE